MAKYHKSPEDMREYWRDYAAKNREKKRQQNRECRARKARGEGKTLRPRVVVQRRKPIHEVIDAILNGATFDADATAKLATRERYADSAVFLLRQIRDNNDWNCNPVGTLVDPHNGRVRLYRLALDFGLIAARNKDAIVPEFTIDDLRKLTATKPRALVALACAGELEDWFSASREVRAGYVLGRLVAAYRDRPS